MFHSDLRAFNDGNTSIVEGSLLLREANDDYRNTDPKQPNKISIAEDLKGFAQAVNPIFPEPHKGVVVHRGTYLRAAEIWARTESGVFAFIAIEKDPILESWSTDPGKFRQQIILDKMVVNHIKDDSDFAVMTPGLRIGRGCGY